MPQSWRHAPRELVEKLAALVPPPRFHTARYHGMLGPCASARHRVVPGTLEPADPTAVMACAAHKVRDHGDPGRRPVAQPPAGDARADPAAPETSAASRETVSRVLYPRTNRNCQPKVARGHAGSPGPTSCAASSPSTCFSVRAAAAACGFSLPSIRPRPPRPSSPASRSRYAPHRSRRPVARRRAPR